MKAHFTFRIAVLSMSMLAGVFAFGQADWTLRSPTTSPSARHSATMAQYQGSVLLFGGFTDREMGDTWMWDGTNWQQVAIFGLLGSSTPPARSNAVMASNDEHTKVVLFGGHDSLQHQLGDTWVFQRVSIPVLHTTVLEWVRITTPISPPARENATMQFDSQSNRMILTGGFSNELGQMQDTWAFDPEVPSWTRLANNGPDPGRASAAMAQCSINGQQFEDRILLFGGADVDIFDDSWVYRDNFFSSLLWGQTNPATHPTGRFNSAMAYYPVSGQVVLYGGQNQSQFSFFNDTWNATCGTWTQAHPAHNPGQKKSIAMATDGFEVVLFGGLKTTSLQSVANSNETWTWGRRVACLPTTGSELPVGSEITCKFDLEFGNQEGVQFLGWNTAGFAPPFRSEPTETFHTESPGSASITAQWSDATGIHSQTLDYVIVKH